MNSNFGENSLRQSQKNRCVPRGVNSRFWHGKYVRHMASMPLKGLRRCETPPSPPAPDPVGIENCKQLFVPLLAFTTQKIATPSTNFISAVCVAFFWVVNATRKEKICLQFLIPSAVFHMLLSNFEESKKY